MIEVKASLKNAPLSAQKGRLIADLVRNLKVSEALDVLRFTTKKGARLMQKLVESAVANAENNEGADIDELTLSSVQVNEAPTLKRLNARAKGRADRIFKRTCHIKIVVSDEDE